MVNLKYGGIRPRILAVDDDETIINRLKVILGDDVKLTGVFDGEAGLKALSENVFSLVLLDLNMPKMDGFEVLQRIRGRKDLANVPVIIMTSDMDPELEAEGFSLGATDFIRKPFIPDVILLRLKRVLQYEYLQKNLEREVERQTELAESRLLASERLFEETVLALVKAIDAKDKYTSGHSQRVAEYAKTIAARCGYTGEQVQRIYYMGLLHDIGKIGIPLEIINKTSRLTDEEYSTIKSHTVIGANILQTITEFPELAMGARSHHERYDGRGYPDGLVGERIPEAARIIAVADAYDAMTSKRSYRNTLPQEKVRSEIEKGRDLQFDAKFADIMLQMIDEDVNFTMQGDHSHEEKPLEHDG